MQNMFFISQRWENTGTQAIDQEHWSFHLYPSQCHQLHNLHSLQKAIHRRNRETTRRPIPRTPSRRRESLPMHVISWSARVLYDIPQLTTYHLWNSFNISYLGGHMESYSGRLRLLVCSSFKISWRKALCFWSKQSFFVRCHAAACSHRN